MASNSDKVEALKSQAWQAHSDGQWIFVARLGKPDGLGEQLGEVKPWSYFVQAIEQVGWYLERMDVISNARQHPELIVQFRRRPDPA